MEQKSRVHSSNITDKIIAGLRLAFLGSLIIFLITFVGVSKNDCEKCSFEYGGERLNFEEAMKLYEEACLKGVFTGEKEDIYVNIDNITLSQNNNYTNISWDKGSELNESTFKQQSLNKETS